MFNLLLIVFLVVCLLLALFILVQSDKGGGISGAVGGGIANANSAIGAQNAENILTRGTTFLAVAFFGLALVIFWIASGNSDKAGKSAMGDAAQQKAAQQQSTTLPAGTESNEAFQLPENTTAPDVTTPAATAPAVETEKPAIEAETAPVVEEKATGEEASSPVE